DHRGYYLYTTPPQNSIEYLGFSIAGLNATSSADIFAATTSAPSKLFSHSLSLYGQDTWKATSRLTLTYGLRWEFAPAPSARGNTILAAWQHVNDPAAIALAPKGTPLWDSTYGNFAPRLGVAWLLNGQQDLVLRVGGGIFYDLGVGASASLPS